MSQKHNNLFRYRFTDGEVQQLAKIYQAGYGVDSINRAYGFSFRSRTVENALHRMGIEMKQGNRKIPLGKESEIVEAYEGGLNLYGLSKIYGIFPSAIQSLLRRNGVECRDNRILTDEQESQLIQGYLAGKSVHALNEEFGTTNAHKTLRRHKAKTRPAGHNSRLYQLNESAFDNLGNETAAYFLGFIYAEGSIHKETLYMALSTVDLSHLEKLKSFLSYEAPIQLYQTKTPTGKMVDVCRLCVHSQKLSRKLLMLGIVKKRSWFNQLLLEQLPEEMYRHFIRGLVDGDGSLDRSKRNNARLRIYEQEDILIWIAETFNKELGIPLRFPKQRTGIMALEYGGGAQARKAITWLYQDATVFLERKINRMEWWNENGPSL